MAKKMDCLTNDEFVTDSKSTNISSENSGEKCLPADNRENLERKDSLSDGKLENPECGSESVEMPYSPERERQFDLDGTLHEAEPNIAEEIGETYTETVRKRLEYIYQKFIENSNVLSDYFQYLFNELRDASVLRNWNRIGELHEILLKSEPYYSSLLMINHSLLKIDHLKNRTNEHGDYLSKSIADKLLRACDVLEAIVDEIMLSFF